jgi:hypothetical protein
MSSEKSKDDVRPPDGKSMKQTNEPWKGPVEKEQKTSVTEEDLERWHRTNTK